MKLIKKIAAIMLSVMMVLGMASVVSADGTTTSGTYGDNNGTITISNAIENQTYKIYRILRLESFSKTGTTGNYAYTVEDAWVNFVDNSTTGGKYLTKDSNSGYVTWKTGADAKEFAKVALNYIRTESIASVCTPKTEKGEDNKITVKFDKLPLGYYLVDSSAGTICSLDTTAKDVTIQEKNGVPSVEKKVQEDSTSAWGESNTADIGQTVNFQTTITAQPGAQNYVLHDKMDAGLTFGGTVTVKKGDTTLTNSNDYNLITDGNTITDGCTFEIVFTQSFCATLKADEQIIVTYSATLNKKAAIAGEGNKNTTKLTYGDSSETTPSTTTTKTFEMPVFKYTKEGTNEKALEGAIFTLSKKTDGTDPINLVKTSEENVKEETYRLAKTDESGTVTSVTTTDSGKFKIQGLDAGTYYLTETQQPAGYNKLSAPIKVVIAENGNITIGTDTTVVTEVKVLNNTGTILPTTGGNGTSLIYFLGAVLALVSGVVLITKQRMKNN